MNEPIKQGDECEVIDGARGKDSPNIGLIVVPIHRDGEHSKYGPMWLCKAEFAERHVDGTRDAPPGTAHFAQAWLRKRPKPPAPAGAQTIEKEATT